MSRAAHASDPIPPVALIAVTMVIRGSGRPDTTESGWTAEPGSTLLAPPTRERGRSSSAPLLIAPWLLKFDLGPVNEMAARFGDGRHDGDSAQARHHRIWMDAAARSREPFLAPPTRERGQETTGVTEQQSPER